MERPRTLAQHPDELRPLLLMCRQGQLYEVERWIADDKPVQLVPGFVQTGHQPKTAMTTAIETGQHSLVLCLMKSGYQVELERRSPLDLAALAKRWDILDLLIEHGVDPMGMDMGALLDSYNSELYERFSAMGHDFTDGHELARQLGESASNRPLFGFAKRHRAEDPRIQLELNVALCGHARRGNAKGVSLCLWAGADAHAPTRDLRFEQPEGETVDGEEDDEVGFSAIEEAACFGNVEILRLLRPDPKRDDFDHLYRLAKNESIATYLLSFQPPRDLTSVLSAQARNWGSPEFGSWRNGHDVIETLLASGQVFWSETDTERIAWIRRGLLEAGDYQLKAILSLLKQDRLCAATTYQELTRTPRMKARLVELRLEKKPVSEREKRMAERQRRLDTFRHLSARYDRKTLYDQVWSQPVQIVAKAYGISGVALAKACRKLDIPVPPRGYWARVRNGARLKRPPLPRP